MITMFINELVGAVVQLILFSLIPVIFWLIFVYNFLSDLEVGKNPCNDNH